jgi:dTMP kinase
MPDKNKISGRFITVEGIEGAGKSTCVNFIRERLIGAGKSVVVTREPGGTALGERLRHLLLDHRQEAICPDAELLLMFAARAEHLARVILPALRAGQWVLCDRFTTASYAYQGGGRGVDSARIAALEDWTQGALRPDLTLLLDLPVALGLERAGKRSEPDRFERETMEFFERVRESYLQQAHQHPRRHSVINATRPLAEVEAQIVQALAKLLTGALT